MFQKSSNIYLNKCIEKRSIELIANQIHLHVKVLEYLLLPEISVQYQKVDKQEWTEQQFTMFNLAESLAVARETLKIIIKNKINQNYE